MAAATNMRPATGAAEMVTKTRPPSLFALPARPFSQATEFFDWDDVDSDSGSEFEEDSPRTSFDSFGRGSETTVSTYEEAITPTSVRKQGFEGIQIVRPQSTQGPKGPHLFRRSSESLGDFHYDNALQMSPLVEKSPVPCERPVRAPSAPPSARTVTTEIRPRRAQFDRGNVRSWSSEQVSSWLYSSGFEEIIIKTFERHNIDGAVLSEMRLEDLRELGIASFGKRHQIWSQLGVLLQEFPASPSHTVIEEDANRTNTRPKRSLSAREASSRKRSSLNDKISTPNTAIETRRRRVKRYNSNGDSILPAESVSIVAIEQLLPKPHRCSKGETCPKWKRQQRLIEQLDKEYGFHVSPAKGGQFFLAGDLSSVAKSKEIEEEVEEDDDVHSESRASFVEPSDVGPSIVASSDLLGPGQLPQLMLHENTLQRVAKRDPQENVKQFLSFQHLRGPADVPPTPPLETPRLHLGRNPVHPVLPSPLSKLQHLPKLDIPAGPESPVESDSDSATASCHAPITPKMDQVRVGTPASEMDVPLDTENMPTIERDNSRSVPPNMHFKKPVKHRPGSRDPTLWRRASFTLPTVKEDASPLVGNVVKPPIAQVYGYDTSYAGWMKKRKTKLLRHEWNEHHYRLKGTQLAMHASANPRDGKAIDTIDVNDYSVACSSAASNSKISAALKNLKIASSKKESSTGKEAYVFQLVPAGERTKILDFVKDGKAHHFAVETRDERIDWMREVMLAKALKQKGEGYEVMINGEKM